MQRPAGEGQTRARVRAQVEGRREREGGKREEEAAQVDKGRAKGDAAG